MIFLILLFTSHITFNLQHEYEQVIAYLYLISSYIQQCKMVIKLTDSIFRIPEFTSQFCSVVVINFYKTQFPLLNNAAVS